MEELAVWAGKDEVDNRVGAGRETLDVDSGKMSGDLRVPEALAPSDVLCRTRVTCHIVPPHPLMSLFASRWDTWARPPRQGWKLFDATWLDEETQPLHQKPTTGCIVSHYWSRQCRPRTGSRRRRARGSPPSTPKQPFRSTHARARTCSLHAGAA
jgi:hypothetical protein